MSPAGDANNPLCAALTVRLPDSVGGEQRRWTDAQATAAWGDPTSILLVCGVAVSGPSDLPCYTFGGVDWLAMEWEEGVQRAVTFGRDPAVEVAISRDGDLDFATVLAQLGVKVAAAMPERSGECTEPIDYPEG